ncbi:5'-methylthioadenosine/S-adenosylhomocysteine nucleosidase [Frondihabitans sucicola]|uniref:adenosylhomocysteine nucleosidase n=1 Tax=Frondihabitans sucicola TaxID=1268041 RepID=A0ABM8GS25_9MICO|nr:5'-methylthioadenosine/S-adenosylhomocysteine nucleosidase [Frondihabitans sucicola]BDZ51264.1 5'-methylthioadenosine/S-adenosylhomocysteine nucleosidase [Frondihabitans sucicola]
MLVGGSVHRDLVVDGTALLLVQSGIGFVNAAGASTSAILRAELIGNRVGAVISAGTAGGLGPGLRVGDVAVGAEYVNLDADARVFGYRLGQVPGMPASYAGDAQLHARALGSVTRPGATWSVHSGLFASSDSFMTPEKFARIEHDFPGITATDMESIAIAQTCHVHRVPFVSIRGISDLAGPTGATDFDSNAPAAAERSAEVVLAVLAGGQTATE